MNERNVRRGMASGRTGAIEGAAGSALAARAAWSAMARRASLRAASANTSGELGPPSAVTWSRMRAVSSSAGRASRPAASR